MIVAPVTLTPERTEVVEFLPAIYKTHPAVFIRNDPQEAVSWTLLFTPWHLDLWLMLLANALVLALILTSTDIYNQADKQFHKQKVLT